MSSRDGAGLVTELLTPTGARIGCGCRHRRTSDGVGWNQQPTTRTVRRTDERGTTKNVRTTPDADVVGGGGGVELNGGAPNS